MKRLPLLIALALVASACATGTAATGTDEPGGSTTTTTGGGGVDSGLINALGSQIPPEPRTVDGPLTPEVIADLELIFGDLGNSVDLAAITRIGQSGDVRLGWLLSDLLRFVQHGSIALEAIVAFETLTDTSIMSPRPWTQITDYLIVWDTPAPPDYLEWKRRLFEHYEPGWAPFFDDADSLVDWRWLSWGGVYIDDRPLDRVHVPCLDGCIPALDDPGVTDAAGGSWYPDEAVVFGVVVGGEARAYPKNIMEVHEMVNDTLGGRRIGMPYCTLCGSAQAYFTDQVPPGFDTFELRTSGLLSRSNKVMYEFHTKSVFDTFTGEALSGPLREEGVRLELISTRTSTWADWKAAHPDTTIVAEDGGIGRRYLADPLQGRDDFGPIFPIGDVDPRLPVQEPVLGVITADGTTIAFPIADLEWAIEASEPVEFSGVRVVTDGAGFGAETLDGDPIATHQAFWFAWSQFHPETTVWTGANPGE